MLIKIGEPNKYLDIFYQLKLRSDFHNLNFLNFYMDAPQQYHVAKDFHLFLIKSAFLQIGI